ncbi:hypothetical protein FGG78_30060 [Thioclava sp. BHET1]|nr:hypothetical protein FGG78_30060 [Thioclava sp. BHET1]
MQWLDLPDSFALREGAAAAWKRLAERYAGTDHTLLLSSEEFSRGQPKSVNFQEIQGYFSEFEQVRILCCLRDQLSYLQSIYLEISKKQAPPPWSMLLSNALKTNLGAGLYLDFTALDRHLRSAFASEAICYLDFTTESRAEGGIIGAVLRHCGIDISVADLLGAGDGRANISPPPLAVWAANQVAGPQPAPPKLLTQTIAALEEEMQNQKHAGRSTLYTREEEMRLLEHFAPLNAHFCEELSERQPGFQLRAIAARAGDFYREDLSAAFWIRIARQLHHAA